MIEFFTRQGGTALLNDSDTKKKYSSRQGQLYREELERRVQEDVGRWVFRFGDETVYGVAVVSRTGEHRNSPFRNDARCLVPRGRPCPFPVRVFIP
jgi:hypothetical protein